MKITNGKMKKFKEVKAGEVFLDADHDVAMKVIGLFDSDEVLVSAIDLSNGNRMYYDSDEEVSVINAELIY